jgi:hypothetical protein
MELYNTISIAQVFLTIKPILPGLDLAIVTAARRNPRRRARNEAGHVTTRTAPPAGPARAVGRVATTTTRVPDMARRNEKETRRRKEK